MNVLRELALTAVFFIVLQLVIPPLIHSRTMNKWTMVPAMVLAGLVAAIAIAYLQFTPFLLGLALLAGTHHTLKVMMEEPFQAQHRQACGQPPKMALYRTSSYLYVLIACVGGWLLQAQLLDISGRSEYVWERLAGIPPEHAVRTLSWPSIAFYCAFGIFVFYQQLHVRNFEGASQAFALTLSISASTGMLTGLAYLIYYGWSVVWWAPLVIFVIGILTSIFGFLLERVVGTLALSLGGFIAWPVCAYFMFRYVPSVP